MRRFSVRGLMLFIVVVAVGVASLRNANVYWAAGLSIAALMALATSIAGALILRGRERCAWTGFAVFTGVYLVFAGFSEFSDSFRNSFGTTVALTQLQSPSDDLRDAMNTRRKLLRQLSTNVRPGSLEDTGLSIQLTNLGFQLGTLPRSGNAWLNWLPGAATPTLFSASDIACSHCSLVSSEPWSGRSSTLDANEAKLSLPRGIIG